MDQNKDKIIELLKSTDREGINNLIEYMDEVGFFESPASTRFHGCFKGGLAVHSLKTFKMFKNLARSLTLDVAKEEIIIASLLHDLCKAGAYLGSSHPYLWNKSHPRGHASLSISRIKNFIDLREKEERIIRYHMGMYCADEITDYMNEYPIKEVYDVFNKYKVCKAFHFADEIATLHEKCEEGL